MPDDRAFYDQDGVLDTYLERREWVDNPNTTLERPTFYELAGDLSGLDIIDLGCGYGDFGMEALGAGARSYTGVEASRKMAERACQTLVGTSAHVEQRRLENWWHAGEPVDLVTARLVLHYVEDLGPVLANVAAALKTGGRFYIETALEGQAAGTAMPFVTALRDSRKVIGSTRFWKIDRRNRKLEIGSTWVSLSWQKTFVNTEAKYLMLRYTFEELDCIRVQFTTDEVNEKSRRAILRLGAKQEGIVRNERIMPDGRKRNSVRLSIIDDEWPSVKRHLEERLLGSAKL